MDEEEQPRHDGAEWGVVPPGLLAYALTERAIGLILALVADAPQDGWAWVLAAIRDCAELRIFTGAAPARRTADQGADAQAGREGSEGR